MVRNEILNLYVDKSCEHDEIHPQFLIEIVDLVFRPFSSPSKQNHGCAGCSRKFGKWRKFHQYLRKELEIKQRTIDP